MQVIQGGSFTDHRGTIRHVNDFNFEGIKRFYTIYHPNTEVIRAWQGHKVESKYFYVIKGSFKVNCIKIDDWNEPLKSLQVESIILSDQESQTLKIEPGYANGFKALVPDSIVMIYSDKTLQESQEDNFRWVPEYFVEAKW
jgi:dTDP-4-dehydrorhamnose 3,5-epimerase